MSGFTFVGEKEEGISKGNWVFHDAQGPSHLRRKSWGSEASTESTVKWLMVMVPKRVVCQLRDVGSVGATTQ